VKCPFLLGDMDVRISNANSGLNAEYIFSIILKNIYILNTYNNKKWLSRKPKLNAQIKITQKTGFPLARE